MGSENDLDKCGAIEVAELLLTADLYNRKENLTEDDLPPNIRKHYFDANTKSVKRPIYVTSSDVQKIYGIDNVKAAIPDRSASPIGGGWPPSCPRGARSRARPVSSAITRASPSRSSRAA